MTENGQLSVHSELTNSLCSTGKLLLGSEIVPICKDLTLLTRQATNI